MLPIVCNNYQHCLVKKPERKKKVIDTYLNPETLQLQVLHFSLHLLSKCSSFSIAFRSRIFCLDEWPQSFNHLFRQCFHSFLQCFTADNFVLSEFLTLLSPAARLFLFLAFFFGGCFDRCWRR